MGYSSKASLLAAVDSMGDIDGIKEFSDKVNSWKFTRNCDKTANLRDLQQEKAWLGTVNKKLRRVE